MILDPIDLVKQLVAIPSVNPMRPDLPEEIVGESRLTDFLERTLTQSGLSVRRQAVLPGRENLVAWLDGDVSPAEGGRTLLLDAHQDTVPVDGMSIEPFHPEHRDGRIYGAVPATSKAAWQPCWQRLPDWRTNDLAPCRRSS